MYIGFDLKINWEYYIRENSDEEIEKWKKIGRECNAQIKENADNVLKKYINGEIVDGSALSDEWFKIIKNDIFVSHSHKDQELALVLSGWLKEKFDVKVFVDEVIWGSADGLLKAIDNQFCKKGDGTYDYNKRNLTTSHVHAMLTTAILNSIDKSETVIFMNTDNSVPKVASVIQENGQYTLSPWIYEELIATTVLRRRDWREHRDMPIYEWAEKFPQISYKVPLKDLKKISMDDLRLWEENYNRAQIARKGKYGSLFKKNPKHPLNYLYSTVLGVQE